MLPLRWLGRVIAAASAAVAMSGCPALLDDDFEIVDPGADASTGGSAGASGAAGNDGSTGDAGAAGGDAGECMEGTCPGTEQCCDRHCVDTSVDSTHCGSCGTGCPGTTCESSKCTNQCLFGWLDCDQNVITGCEVNAANDPDNCGNCATQCAFDQTCENGACTCPEGSANCNGDLEDGCEISIGTDPTNCGACGTSCGANQICTGGSCVCDTDFADCNTDPEDGCEINLASSPNHCGTCGTDCGDNSVCAGKVCGCTADFLNCDASVGCESAKNSAQSCGSCSTQCGGSTPVCSGTSCQISCGAGEQVCSGSCANFQTDPLHCGGCNSPVGPNQVCIGGSPECQPGFGDCNAQPGCETDTTSDKGNCGACGNDCKAGAICSSSQCQCAAGTPNDCGASCQECCNATDCSDGDPCTTNSCSSGSCAFSAQCPGGNNCCPALGCFECCNDGQCTGGKVCSNNQCVLPTCTSPEILCGASCVNPNTSSVHCGTCGNECGAGRSCSGGECTPKWVPIGASPTLAARSKAAATYVPSQSSVFFWGGEGASGVLSNGALYDVSTGGWTAVATGPNTPSARVLATAVWTGQVVVVWGGGDAAGLVDYATGALYDPSTGSWTPMSTQNAPSARRAPYGVYTGSKVLFWGGFTFNGNAQGGAFLYDPVTNEWSAASTANQANAVMHPTVGWSGTSFYVFGGLAAQSTLDFFVYEPATNMWAKLASPANERFGAFGGWDGSYFVTWGGRKQGGGAPQEWSDGRRWDTSGWGTTSAAPASMTARHALHRESGWSARTSGGNSLLVGGVNGAGEIQKDGAIYNSTTNTWTAAPAWPSGEDRRWASGVWAGSEFVLWGGLHAGAPSGTGERFRP